MQLKRYSGFFEQVLEGVVSIAAKGYVALYPGIHQHLGTEYAWWVGNIDCGGGKIDAVQCCLYDYVLLRVNSPAYFMSGSRLYIHLVPEAAKFKAIFKPGGSAVVAGG